MIKLQRILHSHYFHMKLIHWGVTSWRVKDFEPLLLSQLAVAVPVCLVKHFSDLWKKSFTSRWMKFRTLPMLYKPRLLHDTLPQVTNSSTHLASVSCLLPRTPLPGTQERWHSSSSESNRINYISLRNSGWSVNKWLFPAQGELMDWRRMGTQLWWPITRAPDTERQTLDS